MAEREVQEVLQEQRARQGMLDTDTNRVNKKHKKILLYARGFFILGIVRRRGGALHMGKGRSNNAGKKQPNFDDSSNFAKQSQPTEKKKK